MRSALFLPIFDELSDARVVAGLAAEAEAAGWHGVFVWDHIAYRAPVREVADPWIVLSAVACATERVLIGPMVTPLARRRPVKLAREVATLDHLCGGRLVLGVGLGGDNSRELSATGEQTDDRVRAAMLDEALEVLRAAWTGEPVRHHGEHYLVDGLAVLPTPVQRPGPPVWVALRRGNRAPLRRAARHDGAFPIEVESPEQLAEIAAELRALRAGSPGAGAGAGAGASAGAAGSPPAGPGVGPGVAPGAGAAGSPSAEPGVGPGVAPGAGGRPFDLVVGGPPGTDPAPYAAVGASWWMVSFPVGTTAEDVRQVLREGPADL